MAADREAVTISQVTDEERDVGFDSARTGVSSRNRPTAGQAGGRFGSHRSREQRRYPRPHSRAGAISTCGFWRYVFFSFPEPGRGSWWLPGVLIFENHPGLHALFWEAVRFDAAHFAEPDEGAILAVLPGFPVFGEGLYEIIIAPADFLDGPGGEIIKEEDLFDDGLTPHRTAGLLEQDAFAGGDTAEGGTSDPGQAALNAFLTRQDQVEIMPLQNRQMTATGGYVVSAKSHNNDPDYTRARDSMVFAAKHPEMGLPLNNNG